MKKTEDCQQQVRKLVMENNFIEKYNDKSAYNTLFKNFVYKRIMINTKSNFLEKKRQQRKKNEEQNVNKAKVLTLQKNIRAFLRRRKVKDMAIEEKNVSCFILMAFDISIFDLKTIQDYIAQVSKDPKPHRNNTLKKVILSCLNSSSTQLSNEALLLVKENHDKLQSLFRDKKFAQLLNNLLKQGKGYQFLNIAWPKMKDSPHSNFISNKLLLETALQPYSRNKIQGQGVFLNNLEIQISLSILDFVSKDKNMDIAISEEQYWAVQAIVLKCLEQCSREVIELNITGFAYLFELLRKGLRNLFESEIKELVEENKNLLILIEDEEQLEYFENRLKSLPAFEQFCERTLSRTKYIFQQSETLRSLMFQSQIFRSALSFYIRELEFIYNDRRIMFVYNFLSEEASLKQMLKEKKIEIFSVLNMRLITMDDEDFKNDNLFTQAQSREIIQFGVSRAYEIAKKMVALGGKKQTVDIKTKLFQKKDQSQTELQILSNVLNNLNRKCLRTTKIPIQFFINNELDKSLNTFKFGVGARAIELMLKNFPFAFRFESRLKKLKQFIKTDKLNHDRSLFLQEQVNPNLIIQVRRGHQFIDAYESCAHKDLRKKYKIIFFNQQGLEEEGLDGGGIIKQFINQVLKSSFSDIYGMFYETEQNEILPNSYCSMKKEYEFIGKIVGKAVYQGINIEQKFAQPFLNLLIGRQNSFEDLQFIDRQIYKSMLNIRKMNNQDLETLQQTFTILDNTPFGQKKYINLKQLSGYQAGKSPWTPVNSQNKVEFVMTYANYKCNIQLEEKTWLLRKGFLTVMKSQWLSMFSNQELNAIISGNNPNYSVIELKNNVVYNEYHQKSQTVIDLWSVLSEFTPEQKSSFLFFVTSCSRPPTMGFASMKPLICIQRSPDIDHLPTANTCMNVFRLPDYKNRQVLRQKLLYAINAKAGFQFA